MKNLVGLKFGSLTVTEELPRGRTSAGISVRYFRAVCECGNVSKVRYGNLTSGKVKSCGCVRPPGPLGALVETKAIAIEPDGAGAGDVPVAFRGVPTHGFVTTVEGEHGH